MRTQRVLVIAAFAGVAAAIAPMSFTGAPAVDAVERALLAAAITFVAAHGHRWAWIVAGGLVVVPARGPALALALLGLIGAVASTVPARRPKELGAVVAALLVNATLWYPSSTPQPLGWLAGVAALGLLVWSGWPELRGRHRRMVLVGAGAALVVVVVGGFLAMWVTFSTRADVDAGSSAARRSLSLVRRGDSEGASAALAEATDHLSSATAKLDGTPRRLAGAVPVLAQQLDAIEVSVHQGLAISQAADDLVAAADYDELRYQGQVDLDAVERLQEPAARVDQVLAEAEAQLDTASGAWLVPPLRDRMASFSDDVSATAESASLARDLLDQTPGLLGGDGERTYLVAFMTPAELRGAGGFIGSYAELRAKDGRVELTRSGRIEDLIDAAPPGTRTLTGPPDYIRRYGRNQLNDYLQDLTISPDFPSDAAAFAELYPQSGGRPVDGVIGIDPAGLAALLEFTGPVTDPALPEPLTADDVEDLLLRRQYLQYGDRAARGEILEAATRATFDKLTDASLPSPRALGKALGPAVATRHLQLWSKRSAEQALFDRIGATGALEIVPGADGFSVIQQNSGNNKIDAYLERTIRYEARLDAGTGELDATLTVTLRNDVPGVDLPDAVVANTRAQPRGSSVGTLSIVTPHRLLSAALDGQPMTMGPDTEAGLNVYDTTLITVPPGGTSTLVVHLRGAVGLADGYRLQVLPQPVVNPDIVNIDVRSTSGRLTGPDTRRGRVVRRGPAEELIDLRAQPVG